MKSFILKMLILGLTFFAAIDFYSQDIDLTLKYIPETNLYEVYARPDFSQNNFFLAGGSQITVVLPASAPDTGLAVVSVNGGPWSDNSQVYAPLAATTSDFHGIATNGSQVNLVTGAELLLFRFSLAAGCVPGVRIFNNATDPGSGAPGMNGAGFGNYVGNVFTLEDHYGENYNNSGTVCGPVDDDGDGVNQGVDPDDNDPCVPNPNFATCDQDNDGLTNQEEIAIGTNPTNPDTDGDGINDGTEVLNGSNPLNPCDPNPANPACVVDPEVEFTIKFNPVTCTYEVYALPNFTQNNFFIAGGSQITVAIPSLAGNQPLVITTLAGGVWTDNSQVYGPGASPSNDFHAISSDGSMINFVQDTEILLFTFQLPGGVCCLEGVRLFENDTDPDSSDTGMSDGDFDNYFANIFIMDNFYEGNYNNDGLLCDECQINPLAPPTATDVTQDFCVINAPTLASIVLNETNIRWYAVATGGLLLPITTPLVDGMVYYAAQFDPLNNCESDTRLAITVAVDDAPTPTTTDTTQDFCQADAPTVADIQVNETGVTWYTAATAGTVVPATTALVTATTYYGSLTDAVTGCESSIRLAVTVTVGNAPTPTTTDTTQDFCQADVPTVADIQVNETGVIWYTAATGGTIVPVTTALVSGTTYYASLTDAVTGCESSIRLAVTVTVGNAPTPTTTDTTQDFCQADNPTVADIQVNETGVIWYTAATGGTVVPAATALLTGTTYYATLIDAVTGCESTTRLAITITVGDAPTPTTTDTTQDFCQADAPTVADIQVNEIGVIWYTAATGGTVIPATTALVTGTTYYGSLTDVVTGCQSSIRLAVIITVGNAPTPTTTDTTQDFCQADVPTVADIQVNETGVVWYTAATGGTIVPATTALVSGTTYYASLTDAFTGCESAIRLAVTVTIGSASTPTTNDATQQFCAVNNPTIADIQVNQAGVVWYNAATGGAPLPATTPLSDDMTYYGSLTVNGCESTTRLAVTVTIEQGITPTAPSTSQVLCSVDNPTVATIQVDQNVTFYSAATGGSVIAATTPIISGTVYYASYIDPITGCPSATRLAITVTLSNGTTPTTTSTTQSFCEADTPTVADIQVNEPGVTFYLSASGGAPLAPATALLDNTVYYASIVDASGCASSTRLAITVNIDDAATPTTDDTTQNFCQAEVPIVASIQVNESGVLWYTTPTGGTALAPTDALVSGTTYYGALGSASGCASAIRLAVIITIGNGQTPTTDNTIQDFCSATNPTVADLQVNQSNVSFYTSAIGGILIAADEPLIDGVTYYASYIDPITGCESTTRLAIQANVSSGTTPTTVSITQEFCEGDAPTVADIQVNETGVTWYATPTGGTPLNPATLLSDGMTYYASIVTNNCPSAIRLAVTVTVYESSVATISGGGATTCFGTEVTYTTESGNSGYIWDVVGGDIVAGGTTSDATITIAWNIEGDGFVSVSYTDMNGCDGIASAILDVNVTSCADIMISKTVDEFHPRINDNVTFTISVTNTGSSIFTNVVVSENLPSGYEMISVTATNGTYDSGTGLWTIPTLMPGEVAFMLVEATVVFGGGYTNTAMILSSLPIDSNTGNNEASATTEPVCLTVFNEFSPNGDGTNDFFMIDCIEFYPDNTLQVFNRYGSPVFETKGYQNNWDGTANVDGVVRRNEKLPVGTYYYILEVDGKAKTGWVYIMR
ncbi:Ig-like domain-containing protein [Flavobacterium soli]|uniref:Ig-like domain-containing protein n=1 Tax=Flavobacterium soli TaxID=344881 RepID=UPI00041DBD72|nr:gliding motility-associated C-terminal domain-containing protein [Flavobacterium soli]